MRRRGRSYGTTLRALAIRRIARRIGALAVATLGIALGFVLPATAASVSQPPSTAASAPLTIARVQYDGGDWYANPSSLPNLLAAIRARTTLPVARTEARVRLTDGALRDHPFLHITGHGDLRLSEAEVGALRTYLTTGGFLHVSDNYGLDTSARREIARVFPDRPLVDVPLDHAVYRIVYRLPQGVPKIHEHDGKPARGLGIFIGERLALFYDYSADLGNGWEDPSVHKDPPELHEAALRMGVNLFVYAVTSRATP